MHAGIAAINSQSFGMDSKEWKRYASTLKLEKRYPGVSGIGVIYNIPRSKLANFLTEQRKLRPYFKIHPEHSREDLWPITFIEPEQKNFKALGLDMAHENNRYNAIVEARKSGNPTITGPIKLVQDQEQTPGFLFYYPYYKPQGKNLKTEDNFLGVVYAPFIMKNLMLGVLDQKDRQVSIQIRDEDTILYDEVKKLKENGYTPLHSKQEMIDIYGRKWEFNIVSNNSFTYDILKNESNIILIAGIIINVLILFFFLTFKRSKENAVKLAKKLLNQEQLRRVSEQNTAKMATLGEMASGIAHEINNPLAIICGYVEQLRIMINKNMYEPQKFIEITGKIENTGLRISKIIKGLRFYSRDVSNDPLEITRITSIIDQTFDLCFEKFKNSGVEVKVNQADQNLMINCRPVEISQVILNILNNSFDAILPLEDKWIRLKVEQKGKRVIIQISDSGACPIELASKIFDPFFTTKEVGKGTGLGLSIAYGIIEQHKGHFTLDTNQPNTTFIIDLPCILDSKESNE